MNEWIDIDAEWPPEVSEHYLVRGVNEDGEEYMAVCWPPDGDEYWLMVSPLSEDDDFPDFEINTVTHWMRLPNSPKAKFS